MNIRIKDETLEAIFDNLPCLDFRGRNTVTTLEMKSRLRVSKYHLCRQLAGDKVAFVQLGDSKSMLRTPLPEFRNFMFVRLKKGTGLDVDDLVTKLLSIPQAKEAMKRVPSSLIPAPGIDSLNVDDVCALTGQSPAEIANEIEEARLLALDFSDAKSRRRWIRIPKTLYLLYVSEGLARGAAYKPCPRQGRNPDGHHPAQTVLIPDDEQPPAA